MDFPKIKNNKTTVYYLSGAFILLLFLKLASSDFFKDIVDFSLSFLPFIIVLIVFFRGYYQYCKFRKENPHADADLYLQFSRKKYLIIILQLLAVTLLFYILYSPRSFVPYWDLFQSFFRFFSLDNYFLFSVYLSIAALAGTGIFLFSRLYLKSQGLYQGDLNQSIKNSLYSLFFFSFFF